MSAIESPPPRILRPSWSFSILRKQRSGDAEMRSQPGGLLVPQPTSRSSDSESSRSLRSSRSRGRVSVRAMVNRLRSSSSVTLAEQPLLQESDFRQLEDWFVGFQRYNQLITTRVSTNQASSEQFPRICNIMSKSIGGRFVHGLPEAVFDFSLLWCPAGALTRKESTAPSWSWMAWDGPINFPFDPTSCPDLYSMPPTEGEWFRSEVVQYHVGPRKDPYSIRREKEPRLRIHYPPYFHAPRGYDPSVDSHTLRFSAFTIPADGFHLEQLQYGERQIPCSHLVNDKNQHCGVIMDFKEAMSAPCSTGPFEFVLISRNIRREPASHTRRPVVPTVHPPGTPIWDGSRFVWDQEIDDYDEVFANGPWKVLNVILIKWIGEHAERVAIARIHEDAWTSQNPRRKEIVLR